jgi:multimeric flavodoxin WrbA
MSRPLLRTVNRGLYEQQKPKNKVVVLLGTLKHKTEESNTFALCEELEQKMKDTFTFEYIHLANKNIGVGVTKKIDDPKDEMGDIYDAIENANIVLIATPIWWGWPSSLIQKIIERFDEADKRCYEDPKTPSIGEGKVLGCVITGGFDGVQACTPRIISWATSLGFTIPPYSSISRIGDLSSKEKQVEHCYLQQMADNLTQIVTMLQEKTS